MMQVNLDASGTKSVSVKSCPLGCTVSSTHPLLACPDRWTRAVQVACEVQKAYGVVVCAVFRGEEICPALSTHLLAINV